MPNPESTHRKQKAVLRAASGSYNDYSVVKVTAAVEISVRWEERKDEVLDANGNTIGRDALAVVNQDIVVGSIMWLGLLKNFTNTIGNLMQVIVFDKTPDIKGRKFCRTVSLIRFSDKMPATA